jgi:hypothetical protein
MLLKKRVKRKKKWSWSQTIQTLFIITTHNILKMEKEINCRLKAPHMLKKIHKTVLVFRDPNRLVYKMMRIQ